MSTPPFDSNNINDGVKDGVLASMLGGLSMVARLLLSSEPVTFGWVARRVMAASIVAMLVGFGIQDQIQSVGLRMAVVGASGYVAPEALDFLLRYVKTRGDSEIKKVSNSKRAKKPKR